MFAISVFTGSGFTSRVGGIGAESPVVGSTGACVNFCPYTPVTCGATGVGAVGVVAGGTHATGG